MAEQTYDRISLAKGQLDTAIDLFLNDRNYSAAVTLAGAAEEIFGRALQVAGEKAALDRSYESMADLHQSLVGEVLDRKRFVSEENLARDALKHLQESKGPTVTIDLETAACWMLVRAIQNGMKLGFVFERYQEFDNWFHENIVGI